MAKATLPSQEFLQQVLSYDPETGLLVWQRRLPATFPQREYPAEITAAKWNARHAGNRAGSRMSNGYLSFALNGRRIYAHRAAWKIATGDEPDEIDHINGDRTDNRLVNLRDVDRSENMRNVKLPKNNRSGVIGVFFDNTVNAWAASIYKVGRTSHLGHFQSFDEAVAARRAAEVEFGFHENHGQR